MRSDDKTHMTSDVAFKNQNIIKSIKQNTANSVSFKFQDEIAFQFWKGLKRDGLGERIQVYSLGEREIEREIGIKSGNG